MKKRLLAVAALAGAVAMSAPAAASDSLKAVVDAYLQIQTQLAADKTEGIKAPAQAIAAQAGQMGSSGEALAKAARAVESAGDLKAAREAFGPLTDAVLAAGKAAGWKDAGNVRLAFCPMVNRSWLQKEDQIRNPYYGSKMLACGEFKPLDK